MVSVDNQIVHNPQMKSLYLFTTNYPYSTPESFLEEEIKYLSKQFERVVILAFYGMETPHRQVPDNCEVVRIPLGANRLRYIVLGTFHPRTIGVLTREFFRNKVYQSKTKLKAWGSSGRYINNCLYNRKLMCILQGMRREDICYFYWGIGQNLLSLVLKGKVHLVSRFHGQWDLWEESYGGFHSLRTEVAQNLDKAVFIAKKGEAYFKTRYPNTPTVVFPLGTRDNGVQQDNPNDGIVRVMSCSSIYPLKRVPLIFEALNNLTDLRIEWTHIGDGKDFEQLKEKVKNEKREHLTVNLLGRLKNSDVLDFYRLHHCDMFVNMSTSEGVPVAIMEAMSFNIPVLATDVGCTCEEVVPQVGELLSPNPTIEEIIEKMRKILSSTYTPREYWKGHYAAAKNYAEFAEMLFNL